MTHASRHGAHPFPPHSNTSPARHYQRVVVKMQVGLWRQWRPILDLEETVARTNVHRMSDAAVIDGDVRHTILFGCGHVMTWDLSCRARPSCAERGRLLSLHMRRD